ncbi:unnamed protein product [Cyclocybe aegerita]|uniref:Uncharacterized protein n=1 Tax=Cyclocybe aegerita TaxID=1973307 RepID=A0A8S0X365_CYCAE|nr:unnamed protein product [Cyclocybe aegerita]
MSAQVCTVTKIKEAFFHRTTRLKLLERGQVLLYMLASTSKTKDYAWQDIFVHAVNDSRRPYASSSFWLSPYPPFGLGRRICWIILAKNSAVSLAVYVPKYTWRSILCHPRL